MTSPGGHKPVAGPDGYDTVHEAGSSFGQGMDEDSVRDLLMGGSKVPFLGIGTALGSFVQGIGDAIRGSFQQGSIFAPVGDAMEQFRDLQNDIQHRTDLLEGVQGYAHAYMTKNINAQWNFGNNWRFMPFDGPLGPSKGARVRSDGRVEMGSQGLWLILAKVHGRSTIFEGNGAVTLRVRVFDPGGNLHSDSYTRGTSTVDAGAFTTSKGQISLVTSFPVVVPSAGYYVRVDTWTAAWRWWDGGTRLSSLSVIKQSSNTENPGEQDVPDEKESDPRQD